MRVARFACEGSLKQLGVSFMCFLWVTGRQGLLEGLLLLYRGPHSLPWSIVGIYVLNCYKHGQMLLHLLCWKPCQGEQLA